MVNIDVEKEHLDVLQNIEAAIVRTYQAAPLLVDFDVENALNRLIQHYQARDHDVTPAGLNERAAAVYAAVQEVCDWRLGGPPPAGWHMPPEGGPKPLTPDVITACLKRIRKSVQRWNKEGGRQGYLTFIQRFIV